MDESPFRDLPIRERVEIVTTHLMSAAVVGAVIVAMLFVAGHASGESWVMILALVSGGFGYLSQVAAANAAWSDNELFSGICTGSILMAIFAWIAGLAILAL